MTKKILVLTALLLSVVFATAQKFDIGVKTGYLYSEIESKDISSIKAFDSKGKSGYTLGVFARIGEKRLFFQPSIEYRVRTASLVSSNEIIQSGIKKDSELEISLKTIDIPLQIGLTLFNASIVKIYAHAGPVASIKIDNETTAKSFIETFNIDDYTDYESFIWGGQVGIGIDIMRFTLSATYEKGLSDIAKKGMGENDLFMATLGIRL